MIVAFGFKFVVVRSPISGVLDMPGNATEQVSRVHLRKECCLKNKSSAEQAMLLVQRYLDQCKEAAIQQATARIQKCLKRHMMSKFSQAAGVTPPNLVSDSSSDGEIGFLASSDYETPSSDEAPSLHTMPLLVGMQHFMHECFHAWIHLRWQSGQRHWSHAQGSRRILILGGFRDGSH